MSKKNILIVGATGFIGQNVLNYLSQTQEFNLYAVGTKNCDFQGSDIRYIKADITSIDFIDKVKNILQDCYAIVFVASLIDFSCFAKKVIDVNCYGSMQVLDLAVRLNCSKFIYFSSIGVIGTPKLLPVTEEHPVCPSTLYHSTKLFGENIVMANCKGKIDAIIFRITSPIGIGMPINKILSVFVQNALNGSDIFLKGKGGRYQNYIDVKDIAEATYLAINNRISGVYNLAGLNKYSNKQLAELCVSTLGSTSKIKYSNEVDPEENLDWDISVARAKEDFGFVAKTNITQSILDVKRGLLS